jgi:hypothetical protein
VSRASSARRSPARGELKDRAFADPDDGAAVRVAQQPLELDVGERPRRVLVDLGAAHSCTSGSAPSVAASRRTALTRCATELGARPCAASSSRHAATAATVTFSLEASPYRALRKSPKAR